MAITDALERALAAADHGPMDAASIQLARVYAEAIDDADDLPKLGPAFLQCLEALHLTPRARAQVAKGGQDEPANPLDELRQRRAQRINGSD